MVDQELTAQFEALRPTLLRASYRLLGSLADAEDFVQEAWLRLSRAPRPDEVRDPPGLHYDHGDPALRPFADGLRLTDTLGGAAGPMRFWALADVYSDDIRQLLPERARAEDPDWNCSASSAITMNGGSIPSRIPDPLGPLYEPIALQARSSLAVSLIDELGGQGLTSKAEKYALKLTTFGLQLAEVRLYKAVGETGGDVVVGLSVAVVEVAGWLRALDELLCTVWREMPLEDREDISRLVDGKHDVPADLFANERATRKANGKPYTDWTIALVSRGHWLPRGELLGLRWLAGKLLHHGPLLAVEQLGGDQSRWTWRFADQIFPPPRKERQESQRAAYDLHIAGRDVVGSLNLSMALIRVDQVFRSVLAE
jgi:hypothetical protein